MKFDTKIIKSKITFKSLRTKKLPKQYKKKILHLKMQHYKYSYSKQKLWFENKIKNNDLHNIIFFNKKLAGYTCLRVNKYSTSKNQLKKNLIFDTCIIDNDLRSLGLGSLLMKFNNKIIRKIKKPAFLLCKKNLLNFYKKFKWKKINKKNVLFIGHTTKNLNIMSKNFNKKNHFNIKIYI